jgi:2-aminoadipate transaminase
MNYDALLSRAGERMQQSAIRQMGTVAAQNLDIISLAPGYPAPETFAWDDYRRIADQLLRGTDPSILQYGTTRGYPPLLEWIAARLGERDIAVGPEQLLVTTGSQQGLDLVGRVLLDPGDVVLVELPSYTGALTAFRNAQASLVGIPQEADGLILDELESITTRLRQDGRRIKFLYVVPNFQNPTGLIVGREKRRALVEWAERHDLLVVEDDPYGELYFPDTAEAADTRPIKADDARGRVIYLSTFSKTLAPAFRCAFMAAPAPLAVKFETAKQTLDLCTGTLDQRIVYEACRGGVLDRQVPKLRQIYQRKRTVMEGALRAALGSAIAWVPPRGGFFLWVTLPDHLDAEKLLPVALARKVIYVAGRPFFVNGAGANMLRLAFSFVADDRIVEGIVRLTGALTEVRRGLTPPQVTEAPAEPPLPAAP